MSYVRAEEKAVIGEFSESGITAVRWAAVSDRAVLIMKLKEL